MAEPRKPSTEIQLPGFLKAVQAAEQQFMQVYGANNPDARNIWVRESMLAMQAIKKSTDLQKCSIASIENAVVNIALTGATLNPALKEADLIARKGVACLDFRYGGLIRLAVDSGAAVSINAYVVYDCDDFEYDLASDHPVKKYKPSMNPPFDMEKAMKDPKEFWDHVVCVASRAILPSGAIDWVVMPKWQLLKTRDTSMSKNSEYSPWKTFPWEQARKTGIKYHSKTLKGYSKDDRFARAVQLQNDIDGIDPNEQKGRDTGAEVASRFKFATQDAQEAAPEAPEAEVAPVATSGSPAEPAAPVTADGLSGDKLELYKKVAEMTGGELKETNKTLLILSAKKVCNKEDLIAAPDELVKEMLGKVGVKK